MTTPELAPTDDSGNATRWWVFALIGVVGGLLSGVFGVGGGIMMVPALVIFAGFQQRQAVATSLAAIIPIAAAGSITYAVQSHVDWLAAAVLAVGGIIGAQLGTFLMRRIPQMALVWGFAAFQVVLIVSLFLTTPDRGATIAWNIGLVLLLAGVGLLVGVLMGLLGIGGGVVVVPALILFFGASDLVAKGTSLVMMIPGAISGTISNLRHKLVNVRGALLIAATAIVATPIGALVANVMDARLSSILFAILLIVIVTQMLISQLSRARKRNR